MGSCTVRFVRRVEHVFIICSSAFIAVHATHLMIQPTSQQRLVIIGLNKSFCYWARKFITLITQIRHRISSLQCSSSLDIIIAEQFVTGYHHCSAIRHWYRHCSAVRHWISSLQCSSSLDIVTAVQFVTGYRRCSAVRHCSAVLLI